MNRLNYNSTIKKISVSLFFILLIVGSFLRVWHFGSIPFGLQGDEASIGYETYSLIKTGADRWGFKLPVYFISWASGQNTLYAYLSIPFIKIFGLNDVSVRLLSMVLGFLTIYLVYKLVNRIFNDQLLAKIAALFFMFEPWHFMQSRWAFEGNIIPFFILLSIFCLVRGLQESTKENGSKTSMLLSFIPFTFLLYCSAISLFMLPPFFLLVFAMFWKEIWKNKKYFGYAFGLFILASFPFFLFILKNNILKHPLPFESYLPFSLPKMIDDRADLPSNFKEIIDNFKMNWGFVASGFDDKFNYNIIPNNVSHYLVFLSPIGILFTIFNKNKYAKILVLWAIASFGVFGLFFINLNRSASLQTVISIFIPIALYFIIKDSKEYRKYIIGFILIAIMGYQSLKFYTGYFKVFPTYSHNVFHGDFKEAFKAAEEARAPSEKIAITQNLIFNYLYVVFYSQFDPAEFHKSNWVHNEEGVEVYSFGHYIFMGKVYYDIFDYPENLDFLSKEPSFVCVLRQEDPVDVRNHTLIYSNKFWKVIRYN